MTTVDHSVGADTTTSPTAHAGPPGWFGGARVLVTAVVAGLAIAAAMPPWGWWPLAVVGVALLDRLISGASARQRFRRGWVVGVAWIAPATLWMADLTAPGYVISTALAAVLLGAAAALCPPGPWRWLALPGALVLFEALRWRWPFGGVPLATLPMSMVGSPFAPVVRVLGPLLLVAVVGALGVAVAAAARRHRAGAATAVFAVMAALALTAVAPRGSTVGQLDVAVVQGGGPQRTLAIHSDAREVFDRHIVATGLVERPVDLVLWPENVVNVNDPLVTQREYDELAALARELDAYLVPGIFETVSPTANLNASIVFDATGTEIDRYDKVRLVPFGEFVPLRSFVENFAPAYLPRRDVRPGQGPATLTVTDGRGRPVELGIVISWEVFFEDRARDAIGNGGEVLLNPTNGSSYWLTIVQSQQVASSRLRALETGRWVLQAAPTGFSAVISPSGEVLERTGISEQRVLHATVELRTGRTWATTVGVWPMLTVAVGLVAVAHAMSVRACGAAAAVERLRRRSPG